jgi:hypothetical protein
MSPPIMYPLFGLGLAVATYPIWGRILFGFNPTLEAMLRIICSSSG